MKKWIDRSGDLVTDQKSYYVSISDDTDDFRAVGDPVCFDQDYKKAKEFAIEQSKIHQETELHCESRIYDSIYDAPVILWSERYANGKKQFKHIWR